MYDIKEDRVFSIINTFLLLLWTIVIIYPLIFIISASISDPYLVNGGKVIFFPKHISFQGYILALEQQKVWIGYRNTILYTLFGTLINISLTITCAYALSRKEMYGRGFFSIIIIITMFFSGGLIPTYILVKNLNMLNTVWALLLPNAVAAYYVIISRTFFQNSIPSELLEAATVDGCSEYRRFLSIVLPLSAPIIAVMSLFYGVNHWNGFFDGLIYISKDNLKPLQVALREILLLQQEFADSTDIPGAALSQMEERIFAAEQMKYALIIVASIPVLVAYPFIQKYFVRGVMIGALKG